MADLLPRSIEVDELLLGTGTPYVITSISPGGKPTAELGDKPRPREDGQAFGRDQLGGRLISVELSIDTGSYLACQNAWRELAVVWDAQRVRELPGAVVPMRIRQFDGATRWVVGRPNRIDPANEALMNVGRLDVVMDFRCIDHKFYSDAEHTHTVSIIPPSSGGLVAPLTDPLTTVGRSASQGPGVVIEGDAAAWLVSTINGPITNPAVDVPGQWQGRLNLELFAGQYVTVDPQPWSRSVRRNGIANVSGALTQDSPYLSQMLVPPGIHDIVLRGTDATGTATMTTAWRDVFLTL